MIEFEKVMSEIDKTKKRFMAVKDKLPKLEKRLFDLTREYTTALIDDAPDDKIQKITDEVHRVEKDIDILEHLDIDKEIRESLSSNKKLKSLAEEFISQQETVMEQMLVEDERLFENLKAARDALLEAIKARRNHGKKMSAVCGEITDVKRALGQKIPDGGVLWSYRTRRGRIDFEKLFNKIRTANGQLPKY
jgi:chromosome segregation ATPase